MSHWLNKEEMEKRNKFILEKHAAGWSYRNIAAQVNIESPAVEYIIRKARKKAQALNS